MRYLIGSLCIDPSSLSLTSNGERLACSPKAAATITALCERAGSFVSKEELCSLVWGEAPVDDTVVWQAVYLARKVLAPFAGPNAIENLPRRGYRLTAEVRRLDANAPRADSPQSRKAFNVAVAAAISLGVLLGPGLKLPAHDPAPLSPTAQRATNLGDYFFNMRTVDTARKALREYGTVIRLAPQSAVGYAGESQAYGILAFSSRSQKAAMYASLARRYAEQALRRDPQSARGYSALGFALYTISVLDGVRLDAGIPRAFERAIAIDPRYTQAHLGYGEYLLVQGKVDAAYAELSRAIDLEPSLGIANLWFAQAAYFRNNPNEAALYARRALTFGTSDRQDALFMVGLANARQHRLGAALDASRALQRYSTGMADSLAAYAEALGGDRAKARDELDIALRNANCRTCAAFWENVALTQLALGETEHARQSVRVLRIHGTLDARWLLLDPRLSDSSDPRVREVAAALRTVSAMR